MQDQLSLQIIETACVFVCTPLNLQVSLQTIQAGRQFGLSALLLCPLVWELASTLPQKIMLWNIGTLAIFTFTYFSRL